MLYVYVFVCAGSRLFCCVVPNSQRFPYAIGNAVFSAFWFFVPGSRNSYVAAFKLSVYAQPHVARLAARLRMLAHAHARPLQLHDCISNADGCRARARDRCAARGRVLRGRGDGEADAERHWFVLRLLCLKAVLNRA